MRRWMGWLLAVGLALAAGAAFKPALIPGVYDVKPDGTWDLVFFPKNSYPPAKYCVFSQDKPDGLKLDLPADKFSGFQYSRIRLGNAGTVYDLVIGNQKNFFYDSLFIDLNRDGVITAKEEVKLDEKQNVALGYVFQTFQAEVKLDADYLLSAGRSVKRPLDILLTFFYEKTQDRVSTFYSLQNNTLFVGTGLSEKDPVYFAVADADANGCYNDFGTDLMFFDRNRDNKFNYVKEAAVLAELQEAAGPDRKKDIYRLVLFAWPTKIGFVRALDAHNPADYEPVP